MTEKLKVGILLNNYIIPAWVYKILEEIIKSDFAGISLIIKNDSNISSAISNKKTLGYILLKLHERTDKLLIKNSPDYTLGRDSSDLLKDVSEIVINPVEQDSKESFNEEDISKIRKYNLEIIINFGSGNLKGDILKLPQYGIWAYYMSNDNMTDYVTAGYWEVVRKNPITKCVLEILKEDSEHGTIIYCSWESTYAFSINVNRNKVFWRASLFIPRIMDGISKYGDSYIDKLKLRFSKETLVSDTRLNKVPQPLPAALNIFNVILHAIRQIFMRLFYSGTSDWFLLFKINNCADNSYSTSFENFTKLTAAEGKFWADPFVISRNNKYYIFVEEFIYRTNKGHISVIELDNTGKLLSSEIIIDRPYHMSDPFIFELDNTWYMIPETSQNGTIDLFKCTGFPNKWEFTKNIMKNLSALDTTLFNYNGKWWLFTSIDQTNDISPTSTELFLYFSDDIFSGNWESHPCNPIVSDVRTARPAGAIFIHEDKIYRPSQNSTVRYGYGFNFSQILTLTEKDYEETLLSRVEPEWDSRLRGTHTFNFDGNITIKDAFYQRSRIRF